MASTEQCNNDYKDTHSLIDSNTQMIDDKIEISYRQVERERREREREREIEIERNREQSTLEN